MWFLLLAILGGVITEASAQYTATKVTSASQIDFTGNTMYAIKAVRAVGGYDLSSTLKGRFLRYGYVPTDGLTYVVIGLPYGSYGSSNKGYTKEIEICDNMSGEGKNYVFKFTGKADEFEVTNCLDDTKWGNSTKSTSAKTRLIGQGQNATIKVKIYDKGKGEFTLETNSNSYRHTNTSDTGYSAFIAYNTNTKNPNVLYFEIYEIASNKATFKYYQGESTEPYATIDVEATSTIAGLADVPAYLKATYEYGGSEVDGNTDAVAGNTYTVRTSYPDDLPFVIDGTTYFSLGSDIKTALKATSVPTKDIDFAKYAVKMSGNWIDGYLLQDKNGNYLRNTGSGDSYSGSATSKFDIEKSEGNWYLKSQADAKYLVIKTDGTASFTENRNEATALKNLSNEQAYNYISTYCPVGHYVDSYSKDQAGKISFAQILKGEGKIGISADKYYLFEEAEDETFFLTSKESTQHMSDLTYTYQVNGKQEVTFSSLWQWSIDNEIVNANTGKHLNWEAKLSDDKTTTSYRSAVDGYNDYKQAFTIELGINGNYTYYLKQSGKTTIGSINSKPGVNTGYWFIREADAFSIPLNEVGGKSYATMYAPVKLLQDAEDKTKIYTGEVNENGNLHLEEWEGGVIPAYTPLVLVNEEGAASAKFLISYEKAARAREVTPEDKWRGTNIKLQFSGNEREDYRLFGYNSTYGVGFFKPKATGNIPANRGYIYIKDLPKQTIGLQFPDGTTTSIDAAIFNGNNTAEDSPIYDLSGRRIMKPTRGQFYIRGGQKFIAQ